MMEVKDIDPRKHVLVAQQFDIDFLEELFQRADKIKRGDFNKKSLEGRTVAILLYEPSTRTRLSFYKAARMLGADVFQTENARDFSSAVKGESIEDTARIFGDQVAILVIRYDEEGGAERAARVCPVPVINAGDKTGQHPTQALLDVYTIKANLGKLDNLKINKPEKILEILKKEYPKHPKPVSTYFQDKTKNPFKVLISTILSPRAKDTQTEKVSKALFKIADTPEKIVKLNNKKLQKIIYSIGFYKVKSKRVKDASNYLIKNHNSKVPKTLEELIKIPGVGRKVANIILAECYNKPAIAVDIHVFRISNRLGLTKSKKPLDTELALQKLFPKKEWRNINRALVVHGQNICSPISPFCSKCPIEKYCDKIDVKNSR